VPAVIAGLVVGSGLIVAFGLAFYPPNAMVLIDNDINPLRTANTERIIEILWNNATFVERYKDQYITLFAIGERSQSSNCAFGSCALVYMQSESGFLYAYVDHVNGKVTGIAEIEPFGVPLGEVLGDRN
jgi:hypothetical protein